MMLRRALATALLLNWSSACYTYSAYADPDLGRLALTIEPSNTLANGQAASQVTYVLRTSKGAPLPGLVVDATATLGTVLPANAVSDSDGQVRFAVTSYAGGVAQISGTVHYSPVPGTDDGVASGTPLNAGVSAGVGYIGTVHFTSTDPLATLPPDYTFKTGDSGFRMFANAIILRTPGKQTVTATDLESGTVLFQETLDVAAYDGTVVGGPPAVSFLVKGLKPPPVEAGTPFGVTVTALDANGDIAAGYQGSVYFTSTDKQAAMPANYVFTATDAGVHTFASAVSFGTAGTQAITVSDATTAAITGALSGYAVVAGPTAFLAVTGYPSPTVAGTAHSLTVQSTDIFGNPTAYAGAAQLVSTDPLAAFPPSVQLNAGLATVTGVTLKTAGARSVTAIAQANANITGSQSNIEVTPGAAVSFSLSVPSSATAGLANSVTLAMQDAYGNTDTQYSGTVHLSSSDSQGSMPADTDVTGGVKTLGNAFILRTAGPQTLSAADTVSGIRGMVSLNVVHAGLSSAASSVGLAPSVLPSDGTTSSVVTVLARDPYNNAIAGQAVSIDSNGTGTSFDSKSGSTDASGSWKANLTSSSDGNKLITATLGSATTSRTARFVRPATFAAPVGYVPSTGGNNPHYLTAADLNGDGHQDLIVVATNPNGGTLLVSMGSGNGLFGAATSYVVGDAPKMVAAADLNKDGAVDIAVTSNHNLLLMINNGAGALSVKRSYSLGGMSQGFGVAIADFNGDGNQDVAIAGANDANPAYSFGVFLGAGNGTLSAIALYRLTNSNMSGSGYTRSAIAAGDLNGDGKVDLAVAVANPNGIASNGIYTFFNPGNGVFDGNGARQPALNDGIDVTLADVNGDGHLDILTSNDGSTATLMFGDGAGAFTSTTLAVGDWPCSYAVADFNHDGQVDLAITSYRNARVFPLMNMGGGSFPFQPTVLLGQTNGLDNLPWQAITRDFNGDGKPDLAVATSAASFMVLLNTTP